MAASGLRMNMKQKAGTEIEFQFCSLHVTTRGLLVPSSVL